MGCLNSIFQVWSDKGFVQGEKNTGGKGRKGSFQVNHPIDVHLMKQLLEKAGLLEDNKTQSVNVGRR